MAFNEEAAIRQSISQANQLLKKLPVYREPQAVQKAVEDAVRSCPSLQPRADAYVFNNGRQVTLLQLRGTIPITYQRSQYNIPVDVWITQNFPDSPPLCYVTPTPDMKIKQRHKHVDPQGMVYLPYLHEWSSASSNLVDLIFKMSQVFGADPPVFKKPTSSVAQPRAYTSMSYQPQQPAQPQQQPQKPPAQPQNFPQASMAAQPVSASGAFPAVQPVQPVGGGSSVPGQPQSEKGRLVSSVTSRLQSKLQMWTKDTASDIDSLFEKQATLEGRAQKIEDGMASLTQAKQDALQRGHEIDEAQVKLEAWLAGHENDEEVDADEAVKPADVWSQQLFDCVADDHAIEDTLYHLDRALNNEAIEFSVFMKQVRKLAREQFFQRALALKVYDLQQQEAGLGRKRA